MTAAPVRFRAAGSVTVAAWSHNPPPFVRHCRYTGKRAEGIRYERKVQEYLQQRYGAAYLASPWFRFRAEGADRDRWCQPDGLLFDFVRGKLVIVEVKHSHTSDAWWQTEHLYAPVLKRVFPEDIWKYECCEVVQWYDPATTFPVPVVLASSIDLPTEDYKVHICRP